MVFESLNIKSSESGTQKPLQDALNNDATLEAELSIFLNPLIRVAGYKTSFHFYIKLHMIMSIHYRDVTKLTSVTTFVHTVLSMYV